MFLQLKKNHYRGLDLNRRLLKKNQWYFVFMDSVDANRWGGCQIQRNDFKYKYW